MDVQIEGHPRVKRTSPVNTKKGAELYELQIRNAILDGSWGKKKVEIPLFRAFWPRWLEHSSTLNKDSTLKSKRDIGRAHLIPAFGPLRLSEVTSAEIDKLKAEKLRVPLSKKSINGILGVLSNLLRTANKWGELPVVPRIDWFRIQTPEFDFLTFDEAANLVKVAEAGRWRDMIVLILNTGLRIGEVAGLRWDDIDLKAGRLMVRRRVYRGKLDTPKGGKAREIPLNATATAMFSKIIRRLDCPYVFPQKDGRFIRNPQHAAVDAIHRQATLAGLNKRQDGTERVIGWHTLRHTFASHLVMRGVPLRTVQELMGHQDYRMTLRYAHLAPEITKDAVSVLDQGAAANG